MKTLKSSIFALALTTMLGALFFLGEKNNSRAVGKILNERNPYNIIHAKTYEDRILGLSNKKSLPKNTIMVFDFEKLGKYGVWMKDMYFPIDIIWLDDNKKIIQIEENVSPDSYPHVFYPSEEALYIIESNSGFVSENNLKVGNYFYKWE